MRSYRPWSVEVAQEVARGSSRRCAPQVWAAQPVLYWTLLCRNARSADREAWRRFLRCGLRNSRIPQHQNAGAFMTSRAPQRSGTIHRMADYRDELSAAHDRIVALESELAAREPPPLAESNRETSSFPTIACDGCSTSCAPRGTSAAGVDGLRCDYARCCRPALGTRHRHAVGCVRRYSCVHHPLRLRFSCDIQEGVVVTFLLVWGGAVLARALNGPG